MNVLVTGGSGFIGSHVMDKLRDAGHEVRNFDIAESPHHEPGTFDTYLGDLADLPALTDALRGCDAVVHLAAVADVNQVVLDPVFNDQVNVRGTLNVLEAARALGNVRVLYGSTIWVYHGHVGESVDEATPLMLPQHIYTASKLAGEMYCTSYQELYGVPYTILRFGIPYGPRARPAAVVPSFVRKALAGEPLMVAGAGDQKRRFVYVEDLADGIVAGLRPEAVNGVFNLVGDADTSILEIASVVRDIVGAADIVHTEARAGDFSGAEASGAKALAVLDWAPRTSFADGVRRYVEWVTEAASTPSAATASSTAGSAAAVLRHDPSEL